MKTLIIDVQSMGYAAFYAMGGLEYEGKATGVTHMLLRGILGLAENFKTNDIALCWDSKKSKRLKVYPEYKANRRDKKPEEEALLNMLRAQLTDFRKNLAPALGFSNSFHFPGYEADDLIASACQYNRGVKIIVSSDHDLYQLLDANVKMYDIRAKHMFTWTDVPVPAGNWSMVKAIGGCRSDNVHGVPGVGEGTAIKYVSGLLPSHHASYKRIKASQNLINRNLFLVRLPFVGTPVIILQKRNAYVRGSVFKKVCKSYGIQDIPIINWIKFSTGDFA